MERRLEDERSRKDNGKKDQRQVEDVEKRDDKAEGSQQWDRADPLQASSYLTLPLRPTLEQQQKQQEEQRKRSEVGRDCEEDDEDDDDDDDDNDKWRHAPNLDGPRPGLGLESGEGQLEVQVSVPGATQAKADRK